MSRVRLRWIGLSLVAAGLAAAVLFIMTRNGRPGAVVPHYRFVDPSLRGAAGGTRTGTMPENSTWSTVGFPAASIRDDTRFVLSSPPKELFPVQKNLVVPEGGRLQVPLTVGPRLRSAQRIVLVSQIRRGNRWRPAPATVARPQRRAGEVTVEIEIELPSDEAGTKVDLHVEGLGVSEAAAFSHRTAEVLIPPRAYLQLAYGILESAWSQGAVEFEVQACRREACETVLQESLDPSTAAGQGWQDRRLSLAAFSGETRAFVFEARWHPDTDFSFPVWANPTVYAPPARPAARPNVILLSIDTLRADHLTSYGYEHDTAPFIDATFGKQGTTFERCVAAAVTTPPAHMSMFTSVQPCVHGVTTGFEVVHDWLITLAETLRGAGFETGAVTEDGWLGIRHGFSRGFDTYAENKNILVPASQVNLTFEKARAWLERNADKPFFLFLHTFQVHDPYAPPRRYADLFAAHDGAPITAASPRHLREMADYDREIRYTDDELRRLFAALAALGLAEKTIFILTSDHGEEFLEHGVMGHGSQLTEETTRVPLMFRGPGIVPGRRVPEPISHIDIMPTILDLAGVPAPAQVAGVSYADVLDGAPVGAERAGRPHFMEAWGRVRVGRDHLLRTFDRPAYGVQIGAEKLSRYKEGAAGFRYEYYDTVTDPEERKNLYAATSEPAAAMRKLVDAYPAACRAMSAELARKAKAATAATPAQAELDPAQEEQLRALGYLP